jgi:hypothetical protein
MMSDDQKEPSSPPIKTHQVISPDQPTSVEIGRQWWKELKQESFLFGSVLLIAGVVLLGISLVPCIPGNSFIRGIAGNIVAAGVVFILFTLVKTATELMNKSSNPKIERLAKRWGLKGIEW